MEALLDRICQSCNEEISKVELQFCRYSPESFLREQYGVIGRPRKIKAKPFQPRSKQGSFVHFMGTFPGANYETFWRFDRRGGGIQPIPQVVMFLDRPVVVPIPDDVTTVDSLIAILKAAGLGVIPCSASVIAPPGDEDRIKSLFHNLGHVLSLDSLPAGEISGPFRISGKLEKRYFQAIAKIGFHYLLKYSAAVVGYEPEFLAIRDFIIFGQGEVSNFVKQIPTRIAGEPSPNTGHLLTFEAEYRKPILAKMQFFRSPHAEPTIWAVNLGSNPSMIDWGDFRGHWFYYQEENAAGFDGGIQELTRANFIMPNAVEGR